MKILFTFYINALMLMQVKALEVRSSFSTDNVKGNMATYFCSWTLNANEKPAVLIITRNDSYFQCFLNSPNLTCDNNLPNKFRYNYTLIQGSILFNINDLQCSDEGSYSCQIILLAGTTAVNESVLNIKARPGTPTLSNLQLEVQENSNITATCAANLGYPRPLKIEWKTYRNGLFVDFSSELVITAINVTNQGDRCTANKESTVFLKADRKHQNITLACFATNQDYMPVVPDSCTNTTSNFCNQTNPVNVTYGVADCIMSMNPDTTLYQGNSVTFTCYSDGNPPPTYTWVKENDENRTLEIRLDGMASTLTLNNLRIAEDTGTYNCTASNVVNGKTSTRSAARSIVVNPPTTTTTTTTTTTRTATTSTTPTSGSTDGGTRPAGASVGSDDNTTSIIIGVVVGVGGALIIAIIIAIVCYKRRANKPKTINEEPAEKPYNNNSTYNINLANSNLNQKSPQPDLVASEKKMNSSSLNSSFDYKNDGLTYADLTYDNRPRSRKPMAITDNGSIYSSEIQMPEV